MQHTVTEALKRFTLVEGAGSEDENTACAMTLLAWLNGDEWTDQMPCAHPLIRSAVTRANDGMYTTAADRRQLVRLGVRGVIDTWWIPTEVVVCALGQVKSDEPVDQPGRTISALRYLAEWKKTKERPNLSGADLGGAYLSGANLSGAHLGDAHLGDADLSDADLRSAYLSGANLSDADLSDADLSGAYLSGANLSGADLRSAYLRSANLSDADLSDAYLSGANLSGANLSGADLGGAYLRSANLSGADLSDADLRSANLSGADLSDAHLGDADLGGADGTPASGMPAGWKKNESGFYVKAVS